MALTVLGFLAAYLIGAIPVGFLVARAAGGTDIRLAARAIDDRTRRDYISAC